MGGGGGGGGGAPPRNSARDRTQGPLAVSPHNFKILFFILFLPKER